MSKKYTYLTFQVFKNFFYKYIISKHNLCKTEFLRKFIYIDKLVFSNRIEILWRPVTGHLLEVSHHSNAALREWGAGMKIFKFKKQIKLFLGVLKLVKIKTWC